MPSKDKRVISVKVSEQDYQMLETYANTHNMTISALMSLYIKALDEGDIEIEKGEIKIGVDPIGYAVSDDFGSKIERRLDRLRENGYPESYISMIKEQMIVGLDAQIEMLPKKYDARRMKEEIGC